MPQLRSSLFESEVRGIALPSAKLSYLRLFPEFSQIETLLGKIPRKRLLIGEHEHTDGIQMPFLKLNSSYGRWSNFSFDHFLQQLGSEPSLIDKLVVHTAGPSGKRLFDSMGSIVFGHLPKGFASRPVVFDAYPHFYNLNVFKGDTGLQAKGSYFLDRFSRRPVVLTLSLGTKSDLEESLRLSVLELASHIQRKMDYYESSSLQVLSDGGQTVDFLRIVELVKKSTLLG